MVKDGEILARPMKNGLNYFPLDADLFSDIKIKALRARHGTDGVAMYLYLLCEAFKNGYYAVYGTDLQDAILCDLGIGENSEKLIMKFLLERSMFNEQLLLSDNVITASYIQLTYQEAKKGLKRDIEVNRKFWVLNETETLSFIKLRPYENKSGIYSGYSGINSDKSGINPTKESKVNESKVNESKQKHTAAKPQTPSPNGKNRKHKRGEYGWVKLTEEEYDRLIAEFSKETAEYYIRYVDEYAQGNGNKQKYSDWNLVLRKAINEKWGNYQPQTGQSYDISIFDKSNIV